MNGLDLFLFRLHAMLFINYLWASRLQNLPQVIPKFWPRTSIMMIYIMNHQMLHRCELKGELWATFSTMHTDTLKCFDGLPAVEVIMPVTQKLFDCLELRHKSNSQSAINLPLSPLSFLFALLLLPSFHILCVETHWMRLLWAKTILGTLCVIMSL